MTLDPIQTTPSEELDSQYDEYLRILTLCGIELAKRAESRKAEFYTPGRKHLEFFAASREFDEVCFTACNQGGKSTAGAFQDYCDLTGLYPDWWPGHRFREPVNMAVIGNTSRQMRDSIQQILLGVPGLWGTGMIPKDLLVDEPKTGHQVSGGVDFFQVRHASGGVSTCYMKSSESGWRAIQGLKLDVIHADEEPVKTEAIQIYSEMVPRLIIQRGKFRITATPQQGMTDLMTFYFMPDEVEEGDQSDLAIMRRNGSKYRKLIRMTIDDVEHMDAAQKERFKALCPPSHRRSRLEGFPEMGEGRIWGCSEDLLFCEPFDVRQEGFRFIRGLDSGFQNSYTAAVDLCFNPVDETIYVYNCLKIRQTLVQDISRMLLGMDDYIGIPIPTAWPRDINRKDSSSGLIAVDEYRKKGVNMLDDPSQFDDNRQHYVIPGLQIIEEMIHAGKFKVFQPSKWSKTAPWKKEWEYFASDENGNPIKTRNRQNDLMDATRYAAVMLQRGFARAFYMMRRGTSRGFGLKRPVDAY